MTALDRIRQEVGRADDLLTRASRKLDTAGRWVTDLEAVQRAEKAAGRRTPSEPSEERDRASRPSHPPTVTVSVATTDERHATVNVSPGVVRPEVGKAQRFTLIPRGPESPEVSGRVEWRWRSDTRRWRVQWYVQVDPTLVADLRVTTDGAQATVDKNRGPGYGGVMEVDS